MQPSNNQKFDYEKYVMGVRNKVIKLNGKNLVAMRLKRFLIDINTKKGKILEIGCGGGHFIQSVKYYRNDLKSYGSDISENAVLAAKNISNLQIEYVVSDGLYIPFMKDSFDIIVLMDVVEHVQDVEKLLHESARVLKQGGFIHINLPCEAQPLTLMWLFSRIGIWHNLSKKHLGHIQALSHIQFIQLFIDNGFEVTKCTFSRHLIGQFIYFINYYLPKEILFYFFGKHVADQCSDAAEIHNYGTNNKSKLISLLKMLKIIWQYIAHILDTVSYFEAEIFKYSSVTAQHIHLSGIKRG